MANQIIRSIAGRAARKATARHRKRGGLLDLGLGFALLMDRRVSVGSKFLALILGLGLTAILLALELPLEGLLGLLFPLVGFAADVMIDGLELLALPLIVACFLLPHLASRPSVEAVSLDRNRFI